MSKYNPRRSNGHRRNMIRKAIRQRGLPCAICGQEIDYSLPHGDPLSFEVDEIIPVSKYWLGNYRSKEECALDVNNCRAVHRICNQRRGNKMNVSSTTTTNDLTLPLSRCW